MRSVDSGGTVCAGYIGNCSLAGSLLPAVLWDEAFVAILCCLRSQGDLKIIVKYI